MRNHSRQAGTLIVALIAAALLLVPAAQAQQNAYEVEGAAALEKPQLSAAEAQELDYQEATLKSQPEPGKPERRKDEDPEGNPIVAGELIVTYKENVSDAAKKEAKRKVGARIKRDLSQIDAESLSFAEVKNERVREVRQEKLGRKKRLLEQDPNVETVDYNYVSELAATTNDPLLGQQWGPSHIRAFGAWDTSTGTTTKIAIVDGGIDNLHPDLRGAIASEWDFLNWEEDAEDTRGHGTLVAGVAAANRDNAEGIAGVSNGWILDYRVFENDGDAPEDVWTHALITAADSGAHVANLSFAGQNSTAVGANAVNYAWNNGTVVVAAAGNSGTNKTHYPAGYSNAISVGAINRNYTKASYSSYGTYIDVVAPGGEDLTFSDPARAILTTAPSPNCSICYWSKNGTAPVSYEAHPGTSFATPFVSGLASLLAAQGLSAKGIRSRIESKVTDLGAPGKDVRYGYGLINAHASVTNDTAPKISNLAPAPGASIRDRTPTIGATITDAETDLSKADISLSVDGSAISTTSFAYNATTDRLSYTPSLKAGTHKVRITVYDPQGMKASRSWSFKIL